MTDKELNMSALHLILVKFTNNKSVMTEELFYFSLIDYSIRYIRLRLCLVILESEESSSVSADSQLIPSVQVQTKRGPSHHNLVDPTLHSHGVIRLLSHFQPTTKNMTISFEVEN